MMVENFFRYESKLSSLWTVGHFSFDDTVTLYLVSKRLSLFPPVVVVLKTYVHPSIPRFFLIWVFLYYHLQLGQG